MLTTASTFELLIVDDSAIVRLLIASMLENAGYQVRTASSGTEALEAARSSPPSLILLDVQMPDMDGYAVCRELRNDAATRTIPIIFITADKDMETECQAFEAGGDDYVCKPINHPVLLARVKNLLARDLRARGLEGQLQSLVHSTPILFLVASEAAGLINANGLAAQKFGYGDLSELMGTPLEELIPHYRQYLPSPKAPLKLGEIGQVNAVELVCSSQDGTTFVVIASFSWVLSMQGRLIMVTLHDITEQKQMRSDLVLSRDLIRELAARNEAARETERKHIARDVHDELGQALSALRMDVFMLRRDYQGTIPALTDKLVGMCALVDRAIADVRSIASSLRPAALDMGFFPAIDWLRDEFVSRTDIPCELNIDARSLELDELRAVVLYRIIQESLNNISKYAQARCVDVSVVRIGERVHVMIRDDGCGFDVNEALTRKTYGLLGMQERAVVLDGNLRVSSRVGEGTRIELSFPLLAPGPGVTL
jgi:PAS domain S-box-containing protein